MALEDKGDHFHLRSFCRRDHDAGSRRASRAPGGHGGWGGRDAYHGSPAPAEVRPFAARFPIEGELAGQRSYLESRSEVRISTVRGLLQIGNTKKGAKLDFKDAAVVNRSLEIVENMENQVLWLLIFFRFVLSRSEFWNFVHRFLADQVSHLVECGRSARPDGLSRASNRARRVSRRLPQTVAWILDQPRLDDAGQREGQVRPYGN